MVGKDILWNVHGLNLRAHRAAVRDLLVAWAIWKERNGRVFGRQATAVAQVVRAAVNEGQQRAIAGFALLAALHLFWSQHWDAM
jgi:hypothetical protein